MLGERDVSILGRLKDKVNTSTFAQFKIYMTEKLEYIKDKIKLVKEKLLGDNKRLTLGEGEVIEK